MNGRPSIPLPCHTLGIDLSSKAIDLVLLAENSDTASWTRIELEGATAFERARDVAEKMPQPGWYEAHGVYLIALERPFVRFGQDVIRLVQGCVLGALPRELPVWEVAVSQWKRHVGLPIREKPSVLSFGSFTFVSDGDALWPQDAFDALGNGQSISADMAWEVLREWDKRGEVVERQRKTEALLSDLDKGLRVLRNNLAGSVAGDEREFWVSHFDALLEALRA